MCTIDLKDLDDALEEARVMGVDPSIRERAAAVRRRALLAQEILTGNAVLFYVKLRRKSIQSRWRKAGGEERLAATTAAGAMALDRLRNASQSALMAEVMPRLALAVNEARSAKLLASQVEGPAKILREMRVATDRLDEAHQLLADAMEFANNVTDHQHLLDCEVRLQEAMPVAARAFVDKRTLKDGDNRLRDLRAEIRKSASVIERLRRATGNCAEQLQLFRDGERSTLKVIAMPELDSSIESAVHLLVPSSIVEAAKSMRMEGMAACDATDKAEDFLSMATKAGMNAMARAAQEKIDADVILEKAIMALTAAIDGARSNGVEEAQLCEAEELLADMKGSHKRKASSPDTKRRRNSIRMERVDSPPLDPLGA